jgi:hypothetical protein
MATTTSGIQELYEDVIADLMPYYDNAVLLPNPGIIMNTFNISGALGNTVRVPKMNAYGTANVSIADNASILTAQGTQGDFDPTSVSITVLKRGAGTLVSEESLEDGGLAVVRNAVVTRLSRSLAQSTDVAGFRIAFTGAETALTDISQVSGIGMDGYANTALTGADLSLVMSPEALAYAVKREPVVKMFNDVDSDNYQMVATVRNGFVRVYADQIRGIAASNVAGAAANISATLDQFSTSVANLRAANAPTDAAGFYIAVVTPVHELALAKQLNQVGISTGAVGALSDIGNQALLDGLIGQAVGCRFFRSNNLPKNLLTA